MIQVVEVRFKRAGKAYYFDPAGLVLATDAQVVVETARGLELGTVVAECHAVPEAGVVQPLKKVIRLATDEDLARAAANREKEREAFDICLQKIKEHDLDMKLVEVEYTFDENKILFYFTADGRVDFRELVKDLAGVFRTRIELRQIGVRDEAKMIGSYGICGRNLCCSQFLDGFAPVSIKMAKEQGLSLNPTKISGACGRLMCCLKYEQEAYEDLLRSTPRQGATVKTPDGKGVVTSVSLLRGKLKVALDNGASAPADYAVAEVTPWREDHGQQSAKPHTTASAQAAPSSTVSPATENDSSEDKPPARPHMRPHGRSNGRRGGKNRENKEK